MLLFCTKNASEFRPELVNMANSENTEITTVGICSSGEYNAAIGAGEVQQQNEGRNVVEKRSVGVQLSGQSTPQSWSLSRAEFNRRKHSRERQQLNSSASLASTNVSNLDI